jgi:N-acetylglucosamine PTS system EIICBA or EIICB component
MFALPAACLAMYHCARPERRKVVGGLMISLALTAFVTGVTEPIEFSFMFIAPLLYAIHAVLTGISMALVWALGMKDGFGFSAGAIDFMLNLGIATNPWGLMLVGLGFAVVYYVVFRFAIIKFNLPTPGRDVPEPDSEEREERREKEAKPDRSSVADPVAVTVAENTPDKTMDKEEHPQAGGPRNHGLRKSMDAKNSGGRDDDGDEGKEETPARI